MDPNLLFWTGALANMGVVVALAALGVRQRRRGDVSAHRRSMKAAALLVALFVGAYALKLLFLGREALETWSPGAVWVLRVHELCVAVMLLGGVAAGLRARMLRRTRNATRDPADPVAPAGVASWHRRAGWAAVVAAALGLVTASFVLAGMYQRAGLL
ncbi:MAG: DUF420 domain-containing protein [Myxococcota bacterium]|nr:DUF420 domain-containing protein [Myxococcota bacterium]